MPLNHDTQGFLVGERLDAEDVTGRLDAIRDELRALRRDLSEAAQSPTPRAPKVAVREEGASSGSKAPSAERGNDQASSGSAADNSRRSIIRIDRPATAATPPGRQARGRHVYRATAGPSQEAGPPAAASEPVRRERSAGGPRRSPVVPDRDLPEAAQSPGRRGADGRFVSGASARGGDGDDYDEGGDGPLSRAIDGLGNRLTGAVQEVGAGAEDADPAVKAFNEVARPLQRGFGKIMGGGENRKQERWYRRFWTMMRGSRREDRAAEKRQQRVLKSIERKPVGESGSTLWRGLMLLMAPMLGIVSLLAGLPVALAGAVVAGLKVMLTAMGMGRIARRMTIPGSGRSAPRRGGQAGRAATRAGAAGATGAAAGRGGAPGAPPASSGGGGGGRVGRMLKGGARRIPGVGALLGLGFMASDVAASERSDATRAEKDAMTGRAVGGGLGGIGGMAGGAAAGAALGSVVPVIGTAVGGVVGAIAGGYFGGSAGEDVGEKVGTWVTDLRKSNLVQGISQRWEYATTFMSSLWEQTSEGVSARWGSVTTAFGGLWESATERLSERWESLSSSIAERWTSVTDEMKGLWSSAVDLAAQGWGALTDMASGASAWIADKTGIDVAESATRVAEGARDIAVDVGTSVRDGASAAAGAVSDAAASAADSVKSAGSSAWGGVKSGFGDAVDWLGDTAPARAVRRARNEASAIPALTQAMAEAGITDPNEQAAFLGQMHHESVGFRTMEESFNYRSADRIMAVSRTARNKGQEAVEAAMAQGPEAVAELMYGGRMGNTEAGDGHRFRGRGYTQLTGRDNYTAASEALGIDLVNNPDLAADPAVAARIATWYWQEREGLSEAAQRGDTREVTRLINGGHNGLEDRRSQTERFLAEAQSGAFAIDALPASFNVAGPGRAVATASPASVVTQTVQAPAVRTAPAQSPVGSPAPLPATISMPQLPALAEAPIVKAPLSTPPSQRGEGQRAGQATSDVGRDVPDRRIAHIVTGAYSGMS